MQGEVDHLYKVVNSEDDLGILTDKEDNHQIVGIKLIDI
jgi:hypothetical protein